MASSPESSSALILAAGQGKRMLNPDMAKVMHPVGGMPMIGHVVRCARRFGASRVIAVVGHQRESVIAYLASLDAGVEIAVQAEQLGTGHAVRQAEPILRGYDGDVVILSGDVPLLREGTVREMLRRHRQAEAAVTVLTAVLPDPSGYGRVIRGPDGHIRKIVEHKDASPEERDVREINSGIYVFRAAHLFPALTALRNDNAQGEFYLTDLFGMFAREQLRMEPFIAESFEEIQGVNTKEQLEAMDRLYEERHPRIDGGIPHP